MITGVKRSNFLQLPQVNELIKIMEKEAWRDPPTEKIDLHYPDFEIAKQWLEKINIKTDIFESGKSWQEVMSEGIRIDGHVVEKSLKKVDKDLAKKIAVYLGEEDKLKKSDLIFVFGSKSLSRIEKGVELFKAGWGNKIFISGGHPIYERTRPEAEVFKDRAIQLGIANDDIIIEPQSISIADNVRRSLNLMEEKGIGFKRIIIVAPWFGMRRCWAFMNKYIQSDCELVRVCSEVSNEGEYSKRQWWKNHKGTHVVFNEFVKMATGVALNTC